MHRNHHFDTSPKAGLDIYRVPLLCGPRGPLSGIVPGGDHRASGVAEVRAGLGLGPGRNRQTWGEGVSECCAAQAGATPTPTLATLPRGAGRPDAGSLFWTILGVLPCHQMHLPGPFGPGSGDLNARFAFRLTGSFPSCAAVPGCQTGVTVVRGPPLPAPGRANEVGHPGGMSSPLLILLLLSSGRHSPPRFPLAWCAWEASDSKAVGHLGQPACDVWWWGKTVPPPLSENQKYAHVATTWERARKATWRGKLSVACRQKGKRSIFEQGGPQANKSILAHLSTFNEKSTGKMDETVKKVHWTKITKNIGEKYGEIGVVSKHFHLQNYGASQVETSGKTDENDHH